MNKRLLTFEDLVLFYSKYKKSMHFEASKNGEPIVVQTEGVIKFEKSEKDLTAGLTAVRLQACHTDLNLNKSSIAYDVMEQKMLPTFKNRPILGYIHTVDGEPHFYGHNMHIEDDEIVYDEIPVGIIPETNNASLEYDEKAKHYNVFVDGYLFDDYTKSTEILQREGELAVSVEIAINSMSYNAKEGVLNIEDGYFAGVTILGKDDNGNVVKPGMANSNITLKDFSRSNNSMFSQVENNDRLIEVLDKLNDTLSNFNIKDSHESNKNYGKEDEFELADEILVNETVTETEETTVVDTELETTEEVVATENEEVEETEVTETDEVTETEATEEVVETEAEEIQAEGEEAPEVVDAEFEEESKNEAEKVEESEEANDEVNEVDETVETTETPEEKTEEFSLIEKSFEVDGKKYSVSFTLSHEDIRYGLYNLIEQFCSLDNEWYDIRAVYDDHFVMQGWFTNKIYGCKYVVDGDNVALDGERYTLHEELLTDSEYAQLNDMRSNYSSIQTELNGYKEAELNAQREAVFADEAYAEFVETDGFKAIKENISTYSLEELRNACELEFAKQVRSKGAFSLKSDEKAKAPTMFAFGKVTENKSSFLDGLLNLKK